MPGGVATSRERFAGNELLLGSGSSRDRRLSVDGRRGWTGLVTLDMVADHNPDVIHDLEQVPWPFADDTFEEVHAYELLEHLGRQGHFSSFFLHFSEIWRILRSGGILAATCPSYRSMWAWGDPGHTRVLTSGSLVFLDQEEYHKQVGVTSMSDYRAWWAGDFRTIWVEETAEAFRFVLQAVKPARTFSHLTPRGDEA